MLTNEFPFCYNNSLYIQQMHILILKTDYRLIKINSIQETFTSKVCQEFC